MSDIAAPHGRGGQRKSGDASAGFKGINEGHLADIAGMNA
jgi:hypothetical protein